MKRSENRFHRITSSIRDYTALLQAFEDGATLDDVKRDAIELLSPYFTNPEILEEMVVNALMPDVVSFAQLRAAGWPIRLFESALGSHRQAKAENAQQSLKACVGWLPDIYSGLSVYWSQFHLEVDKSILGIEEFVHESSRNIGALVEGATKPVVMELLHQVRIGRGEHTTAEDIKHLSLGDVINELIQKSGYPSFFAPPPWGVRLNQWRNMAQHFSIQAESNEVVGTFGLPSTEIRLTRGGLLRVLERLGNTFAGIRLAQTVFFFDNLHEIKAAGLLPVDVTIRPEMQILNFTAGLAAQGFDLVSFRRDEQEAVAIIRDKSFEPPEERRLHTFQLAGALWVHTGASAVSLEYQERDGTRNLQVKLEGELCEKVCAGELPPATLVYEAEVIDLKTGAIIPRRPPETSNREREDSGDKSPESSIP
jgi:hypothetical protein